MYAPNIARIFERLRAYVDGGEAVVAAQAQDWLRVDGLRPKRTPRPSDPAHDAALFAIRSPLSKGVILADEVGLGKTIEAALVIAQCLA
jgi:hypothetical protein